MVHELIGEAGLIFDQESDAIFPGNILCGSHDEFIPANSLVKSDAEDFPAGNRTSNRDAMDHSRKGQVVHITRGSSDLFAAFLARDRLSDLAGFHVYPSALWARQRVR